MAGPTRWLIAVVALLFSTISHADTSTELVRELRAGIEQANQTGAAVVTLGGRYDIERPIKVSSHNGTADFPRLSGVLTVDARAASFHVQSRVGFVFEGTARPQGKHARILFDGGRIHGGEIAIRCVDLMSSSIAPYSIEGADVGIQCCIFRSWSENCGYGGMPGREMYGRRCRRILEFYGREDSWKLLGKPKDPIERDLKFESYAGTTISDIVIAGATDPTVDGQVIFAKSAAIYRSTIERIRGNTPNGGGSLVWSDCPYWRATAIRDIAVETANKPDRPRSAAVRFAAKLTARPSDLHNIFWMGGQADPIDWGENEPGDSNKRGKR
ncbi:MAG: hypothetical protein AAFX06_13735 [Planctomycetota bacterium]